VEDIPLRQAPRFFFLIDKRFEERVKLELTFPPFEDRSGVLRDGVLPLFGLRRYCVWRSIPFAVVVKVTLSFPFFGFKITVKVGGARTGSPSL